MFIASKYEEVLSPHVQNFRHVADDGFTEEEILSAERFVLAALNYDLSYPNPMNFLRRISKADNYDIQTRTLGKYLLEIGCLDHRFLAHPPSQVAAAAMYLARLVLERGPWVSHHDLHTSDFVLTFTGQHPHTLRRLLRGGDSACPAADDRLPLWTCRPRGLFQEVC
jgi:transcription initiation factor TFIIIB Brf1 subunit/transcription initiation factor TFIIB